MQILHMKHTPACSAAVSHVAKLDRLGKLAPVTVTYSPSILAVGSSSQLTDVAPAHELSCQQGGGNSQADVL